MTTPVKNAQTTHASPVTSASQRPADPPSLTRDTARFNDATVKELRIPASLDAAQRKAGLHLNRITVSLTGNSHFPNWWKEVPKDTEFIIVQGSAFKGKTVQAGYDTFRDAAIVYAKKAPGIAHETHLDIPGVAGEQVRVLYMRAGEGSRLSDDARGRQTIHSTGGAAISGDPHFRDVKLEIIAAPTTEPIASPKQFVHYQKDVYGWGNAGDQSLQLGAGASEELAKAQTVTPMMANGKY
ncbi:MAG: hypothetical protein IT381_24065 [Deltaproteobacteria bacterium]|nr:hypothetical protein [Deltaproteobacteria bacterium]